MGSVVIYPAISLIRKEEIAGAKDMSQVYQAHVTSSQLAPDRYPVRCEWNAHAIGSGVQLNFTCHVENLDQDITVVHRILFVERIEIRERIHHLSPVDPSATTEMLVSFIDDCSDAKIQREYCHASVYDTEHRLLANHDVVFNRAGQTARYPFSGDYTSNLDLGYVTVDERNDSDTGRWLRVKALVAVNRPTPVSLLWEAMGSTHRDEVVVDAGKRDAVWEYSLDQSAFLVPGLWSLSLVDEQNLLLAHTLLTVGPRPPDQLLTLSSAAPSNRARHSQLR